MSVPLRGSDVRRKFIRDEFHWRVVREVEGAALEMRFASNRRNVGSNPMLSGFIKTAPCQIDKGAVFVSTYLSCRPRLLFPRRSVISRFSRESRFRRSRASYARFPSARFPCSASLFRPDAVRSFLRPIYTFHFI